MTGSPALPTLPVASLEHVRHTLSTRIREGLARDGAEIRALPAFLGPPSPALTGHALAVDTGGTSMRAAVVEIGPNGDRVVHGPVRATVPTGRDGAVVDAAAFFGAHARLVLTLVEDHGADAVRGLPVGYCFSYPSESLPNHDARLIRWTKGVNVSGVEGTAVGAALSRALTAVGLVPGPVAVLNDTVAALMGGARGAADPARTLGLIVGTGTNMAGFFDVSHIGKVKTRDPDAQGFMAVNLESGNFDFPHRAACDVAVDEASDNPGAQLFEKAVSGHYLPLVARALDAGAPGDSAGLVARARAGDALCQAVLFRSADLVAAALAGAADAAALGQPMRVLAEGGLFWSDAGYSARVADTLVRLDRPLVIERMQDANLIGAAAAALSVRGH